MRPPLAVHWRDVDDLYRGHGVNVDYRLDDDASVTLAFVVGFGWREGAQQVEVQVLRESHRTWSKLPVDIQVAKQQLREVVREILDGGLLTMRRGRFEVVANA